MQFTIHCPPNLMARIYNIGTWCTQLLTDLHKKWTQLLVSLPLLALILLHTLSPYKSNNLSLSLSNAHVSDTRALVIVKNWSKPEIVGQTDDVGQSGHWPLRECPFVHHLVVRQNNSNDHSSNIINNNDDGSSSNNNKPYQQQRQHQNNDNDDSNINNKPYTSANTKTKSSRNTLPTLASPMPIWPTLVLLATSTLTKRIVPAPETILCNKRMIYCFYTHAAL